MTQSTEVRVFQQDPLLVRHRGQRRPESLGVLIGHYETLGIDRAAADRCDIRELTPCAILSYEIDRPVAGDLDHPCQQASLGVVIGMGVDPDTHQHILRDVFSIRTAAQHAYACRDHDAVVPIAELDHRVRFAPNEPAHQLLIHVSGPHHVQRCYAERSSATVPKGTPRIVKSDSSLHPYPIGRKIDFRLACNKGVNMNATAKREAIERLLEHGQGRREFAKRMVVGGLAAYGTVALGNSADLLAQQVTDVDILNFALNLEYLEAEFYSVAASGVRIAEVGIGVTGPGRSAATVGGSKVALDARVQTIADQIAHDERAHVQFIRAALGSSAVAKPAINLAALGVGFTNQAEFLTVGAIFEDVGVSAYLGAAPLIDSRPILAAAAAIALTEAQHASVLRLLAWDAKLAVPLVDAKAVPIQGQPNGRLFFVDPGNGLSKPRTTSEVLKIVYANSADGTRSGGFFPDGLNGTIATA